MKPIFRFSALTLFFLIFFAGPIVLVPSRVGTGLGLPLLRISGSPIFNNRRVTLSHKPPKVMQVAPQIKRETLSIYGKLSTKVHNIAAMSDFDLELIGSNGELSRSIDSGPGGIRLISHSNLLGTRGPEMLTFEGSTSEIQKFRNAIGNHELTLRRGDDRIVISEIAFSARLWNCGMKSLSAE